jgi:hypothetical protein
MAARAPLRVTRHYDLSVTRNDPGRNDPCPCGSGLKYKRCHLFERDAALRVAARIHDRDRELRLEMAAWAEDVLGIVPIDLPPDAPVTHFVLPMLLFHSDFDGSTVARRFLETNGAALGPRDTAWLQAQMASWISVWEVEDVDPGYALDLRDLLTGETRSVREQKASLDCRRRTNLLTRVVDFEGSTYLAGTHPIPLPPFLGNEVVKLVLAKLRVKKRLSPRRLRGWKAALIVAEIWDDVVDALAEAFDKGPELVNTDGDPILGVTDRYTIADGMGAAVRECIRQMPATQIISDVLVIMMRNDTIVANIDIEPVRLRVEANSIARADSARAAVEHACGERIRFHSRAILDPTSKKAQEAAMARAPKVRSADDLALARAYKQHHYANWVDEPIPMLDGLTPRQAMQSEEGRRQLDLLIRDMEYREEESDPQERFDMASLRRELGLPE